MKRDRFLRACVSSSILLLNGACATMFNSGSQSVQISASDGGKHKVTVSTPDGAYVAHLPTVISTSPSTFTNIEVKVDPTDCLYPASSTIRKSVTPSYWVNILNGYGFLIDPLTGAMWKYDSAAVVQISKKDGCKDKE